MNFNFGSIICAVGLGFFLGLAFVSLATKHYDNMIVFLGLAATNLICLPLGITKY